MFDNLFGFFEKLLTNFTWTRLTFTVVVILLAVSAAIGYEVYTHHFMLNRTQDEVKILEQLVTISEKVNTKDKQDLVDHAFKSVILSFNAQFPSQSVDDSKPTSVLSTLPRWLSRAIYILLPWFFMSVMFIFTMNEGRGSAIGGVMAIALIFVVIGAYLPEFSQPWILKWLYPWGSMVLAVIAIMWFDKRQKQKAVN